jgi:hypothetical protein
MTTARPAPATTTAPAATGSGGAVAPGRSARLPSGELRRLVAAHLSAHAGAEFTPGEVARVLHRSAGAVANALATLVVRGEAEQSTDKPARYRATPATHHAAAPAASTAPAAATPAAATRAARPARPRKPTPTTPATSGSAAGAPVTGAPVAGPVRRPNGQLYHPRTLSGLPDVTALRKLRAAGVPVLLYGPPGTGKTSVAEAAYPDLITVQGDGDTTVADLVGEYTQTPEGRYVFVHGPLVTAMREGRALLLDDATLIPPSVLAVVYPAMDGRRQITVKANSGETITAADGFYVAAGHNPGVHGAVLTDALSSRFSAQIQVSTDYALATQLRIDSRAVRVARNLATIQAKGDVGWAPQLRELIAFQKIADVLGVPAAAANLIGIAPEEDQPAVTAAVTAAFGTAHTPLALGTRI